MKKSTAEVFVKMYAIFALVSAILLLIFSLAMLVGGSIFGMSRMMNTADFAAAGIIGGIATAIAVVLICLAVFDVIVGYGLWQHKSWVRTPALIFSIFSLILFIPVGTALGGIGIWLFGVNSEVKSVLGVKSSKASASKSAKKVAKKSKKKKKQ